MKSTIDKEIEQFKRILNLQAHPEGGYFSPFFKSTSHIKSNDAHRYHNESRMAGSSIYYFLKGDDFSAWHRLKSDEIWHYYKGSAVKIHVLNTEGNLTTHLLGDPTHNASANFQIAIKAQDWFAAENVDKTTYCLVGCTVMPGFEFKDFELGDRLHLMAEFPQYAAMIEQFTRDSACVAASLMASD